VFMCIPWRTETGLQILNLFTNNISSEVLVRLPVLCNIVSHICRIKKEQNTSFKVFYFSDTLKYTKSSVKFYLYDNANLSNHILIFSTNANLIHLANSKVWVCGGFFDVHVKYNKIYTMQELLELKFTFLFFCLTREKKIANYCAFCRFCK
jgi:hypothetical protein